MPDPSPSDPRPTGDAASPFDTDEIRPIQVPAGVPAASPASEGYDLEGYSVPEVDEPPPPVAIPSPPVDRPGPKPRPKPTAAASQVPEGDSSEFEAEISEVYPVWTRGAEWGPDLVRVGAVGLGTLVLTWLSLWSIWALFFLMVGGAATVLLSYPILITLERPVRITPEQAVEDYFAAASHHFPHYRRMWLLLSSLGRESGSFTSFEDFRAYWMGRIERWKAIKGVGKYTPLKFEVDSFRADKSTGKSTSRADYTVNVYIRDRESEGPIESIKMAHGLIKGPDRMWYLNRGTLDQATR